MAKVAENTSTETTATELPKAKKFGNRLITSAPYMHWTRHGQAVVGIVKTHTTKSSKFKREKKIIVLELLEAVETLVGKGKDKKPIILKQGESIAIDQRAGMPDMTELPLGTKVEIVYTHDVPTDKGHDCLCFDVSFEEPS